MTGDTPRRCATALSDALPATTIDAPAPWQLRGDLYVSMLRFPRAMLDHCSFTAESLHGHRRPSRCGYLMFADYHQSPVGPYQELLFIPGAFLFGDGRRHWSVSRIFVSSPHSAVNGQRNWGLPKQTADFRLQRSRRGELQVEVSRGRQTFAELALATRALSLPFRTALLPTKLRTLGQRMDGIDYICMPELGGRLHAARLLRARADAAIFPDLGRGRAVATLAALDATLRFPPPLLFAAINRESEGLRVDE